MNTKKKPLDDWQIADAERLRAIFKQKASCSQAAFGATYDIGNQSMVGQYLRGERPLNIKAARKFALGLGISIEEFSPELASQITDAASHLSQDDEDEFVTVRRLAVRFSAGHGSEAVEEEESRLSFRREYLREIGANPANVVAVYVSGSSMIPTLLDGAIVLIDKNNKIINNNKIYGIRYDGQLLIKRVLREHGKLIARSDNPVNNPDIDLEKKKVDFEVLGRAFWCGFSI